MTESLTSPGITADPSLVTIDLGIRQAELSDKMRLAVENAAFTSAESMTALRAAISEFTIALRNAGTTPEAVLISLKAVINSQVFAPMWHISTWPRPQLGSTMTTWCIEEYFRQEST